jgi:carboxypeptidase PM20D1
LSAAAPETAALIPAPDALAGALAPGALAALVVVGALVAAAAALAAVVLARAWRFHPPAAPPSDAADFDPGPVPPAALERLSAAIRIPTVSQLDYDQTDFAPFDQFKAFLATSFPLFHQHCELEVVNGYALVYRWPAAPQNDPPSTQAASAGAGAPSHAPASAADAAPTASRVASSAAAAAAPSHAPASAAGAPAGGDLDGIGALAGGPSGGIGGRGLEPIALMAHYDVVPVEAGTEAAWQQPPFSGAVVDGIVWGRGTLDIKSQLTAQLEAAEGLMRAGFRPRRDVYFCYGHDEETGGQRGAAKIVEHLKRRGIRLAGVLDEGGLVLSGALPGVGVPVALIGVAEKGLSNYRFRVEGAQGHSSTPPPHTSLGLAAQLISLIERHPRPARLIPPVEAMLRQLAGQMGFATRLALANLWLFRPLLLRRLAATPATNALARTTFAVTMSSASQAANVLPKTSHFTLNARILPGDTPAGVRRHFEALIARAGIDARVEPILEQEASPTSPSDSAFYRSVEQLAREFYPSALVAPYLVVGGTDARKFHALARDVLRFTPMRLTDADRQRVHGADECISLANYARMIAFYNRLLSQQ